MVQRLVRPELLRRFARAQPARPRTKPTQILARRILATPHQSRPLLRPLQHPARLPVRRLRLPRSLCPIAQTVVAPASRRLSRGRLALALHATRVTPYNFVIPNRAKPGEE